ncbi:MAG: hypothetical protein HYZ49_01355 [Chloroflexi bacterium]|nr:hypothetical protein [Chloroflexota bacterium]
MSSLTVLTDSRSRTLSAVLAATDWPEREQRPLPRGVHPQAAALRKHVADFKSHPAVAYVQAALNADPDPRLLFARAVNDEAELAAHLNSFAAEAGLEAYWAASDSAWAEAVAEVQARVNGIDFATILDEAFGTASAELIILPNLAYPTTHSLGFGTPQRVYSLMPPRKAVGESPPWPFRDDRDYILRLAIHDFTQCLLADMLEKNPGLLPESPISEQLPADLRAEHPTWTRQITELFAYGMMTIFLNRLDDGAGDSFALFERRTRKLTVLPAAITAVAHYLDGRAKGQIASINDYLPQFVTALT